ncbi:MAG TPA: branched-chain amino acid ABC transporter permease [Firmicutes bacterium]|nr:branched-chain amino acid ABC transporter permease [Bacillota bacterium]
MRSLYSKLKIPVMLVVLYGLPFVTQDPYVMHLANMAMIYSILALSLNVLTGFTGQFSVGHAAFYGIGAYTSGLITVKLGWPIWAGFIAAGVIAGLAGLLLGIPTLRLRGLYLAVATLGFGEIVYQILVNWVSLTNGPKGLTGVPSPTIGPWRLDMYHSYYYLSATALIVVVFLVYRLYYSRVGRAMLAIRENELAAEAMGINSTYYKITAFTISSFFAGIAGALYAHEIMFVSPESFVNAESVSILCMMVVGGVGSIPGSIVGAIALTIIPEYLRAVGDWRLVLYGAVIVLMVTYAPQGLGGWITALDHWLAGTGHYRSGRAKKDKVAAEV